MTQKCSAEELAMRDLVIARLRTAFPRTRIVHELGLRYSFPNRVDLAAVMSEHLVGVEIKSSRDNTKRLEAQIRAFLPIAHRVIVALAPRWWADASVEDTVASGLPAKSMAYCETERLIRSLGSDAIEVWTCDAAAGVVQVKRPAGRLAWQKPWPAKILDMLRRDELLHIAGQHRVQAVRDQRTPTSFMSWRLAQTVGTPFARCVVRSGPGEAFGAASDPPIVAEAVA